jgi:hypothetical protein
MCSLVTVDENLVRAHLSPGELRVLAAKRAKLTGARSGSGGRRRGAGTTKADEPKPGAEKRREQRDRTAVATNQNETISQNSSDGRSVKDRRKAARPNNTPGRPPEAQATATKEVADLTGLSQRRIQQVMAEPNKPKPAKPARQEDSERVLEFRAAWLALPEASRERLMKALLALKPRELDACLVWLSHA